MSPEQPAVASSGVSLDHHDAQPAQSLVASSLLPGNHQHAQLARPSLVSSGFAAGQQNGQPAQAVVASSVPLANQAGNKKTQFMDLPVEIRMRIFTEAICKPNIQFIRGTRIDNVTPGAWSVKLYSVAAARDKSGYRVLDRISEIDPVAAAAVRLATEKKERGFNPTRLPFKVLKTRIDFDEDLIFIDIPNRSNRTPNAARFGWLHPDHQFLAGNGNAFNPEFLAFQVRDIQKLALKYSDRGATVETWPCDFRCGPTPIHTSAVAPLHPHWRMCPEELFGFLNSFPKLREIYIILEPGRQRYDLEQIDTYIANYYSLPPTCPLRRDLAIFHGSDTSYLELDRRLERRLHPDLSAFPHTTIQHAGEIRALLRELKDDHFLADTKPSLPPAERARRHATLRMPLPYRQALVGKVLVAVPDGKKKGYGTVEEVRAVRGFLGV